MTEAWTVSRHIADRFAASDSRIIVKPQDNKGMAEARNTGYYTSNPTNKFVIFIDVDDRLMPDALETLRRAIESRPAFVAVYRIAKIFWHCVATRRARGSPALCT
jgi:glycosyltransferase involved in cell wall biosynthesis